MLEVCPVCSDIMSEIDAMYEREATELRDLSSADIENVRDALDAMFTAEAVDHFMGSWYAEVTGIFNGIHGPEGELSDVDTRWAIEAQKARMPRQTRHSE